MLNHYWYIRYKLLLDVLKQTTLRSYHQEKSRSPPLSLQIVGGGVYRAGSQACSAVDAFSIKLLCQGLQQKLDDESLQRRRFTVVETNIRGGDKLDTPHGC